MKNDGQGLHIGIVSWSGFHERAAKIADEVKDACETITVVYSGDDEVSSSDHAKWLRTDDADFFGRKMEVLLKDSAGEIFLLIQADVDVENWADLAARCRAAFAEHPELGIWSPEIDYTPLTTDLTRFTDEDTAGFTDVIQTDAIVLALRRPVIEFLKTLEYHENNLGWGIDYAAIAHCLVNGYRSVRDSSQHVQHARGSGYSAEIALNQMHIFLSTLPSRERRIAQLLLHTVNRRRENQHWNRASRTGIYISTLDLIKLSIERVLISIFRK